ncbi:hypothetical protein FRC12_010139 [Ceratobasidium sp. 428]|nr:hypothetical protein FRC12_010139 [Ceratobasidium sp. 428]
MAGLATGALLAQSLSDDQFVFRVGPRPAGTPGRDEFNLQTVLGLDHTNYTVFMRGIRGICMTHQLDLVTPTRLRSRDIPDRIFDDAFLVFPHLRDFERYGSSRWPVECAILIIRRSQRRHLHAHPQ